MSVAHRHDDLEFNLADVDLEYLIDGTSRGIPAGTVAVFWATRPHQLIGGSGGGTEAWLTVPLRDALAWRVPPPVVRRLLDGELLLDRRDGLEPLDSMVERWAPELEGRADQRRVAALEIEAMTLRLTFAAEAQQAPTDATAAPVGARRGAASAMAAYVSERAADDLTVGSIAAHVHLTPQYAMTAFRAATGITLGDYLAQCRVAIAQQLLLTTDMAVPDVAFASGFRSQSQFYDRFARHCGEPPGAYRRRLRAA